ncbi:Allophanate hydrolase subunit 1 [Mycobacterium rhizamassiliense]|jgi:KipI family sensor histidine kinase inhibitor|uniref:Allophanate hydrolase subunit 1 n=1 Tax=Mycobacterium rhizamassiliense TaxID=1841860 RepID=A0A2U3NP44_9MYCO|nr:allophanate hydrolase subunit 1 [Mycobacterium rhizamassiliense]SPM33308.1 Allophanate hydrolase subunit 1 [Mycobacterium rhizamassiliense]
MSVTDVPEALAPELVGNVVLDYGDQALLVQCGSTAEVLGWATELRAAGLPGVLDVVPAARTVLVKLAGPRYQGVVRQRLRKMRVNPDPFIGRVSAERRADVVIDVVYDGPDLAEVANHTGLTTAQVVHAHTSTLWRVGFSGFAPGFAYLVDGDPRLRVPRRAEPRTSVPAGSVALAGEFSAVYPRQSPGGWQLIGHTDAALWDLDRPNPALLTRGTWVQFRAA